MNNEEKLIKQIKNKSNKTAANQLVSIYYKEIYIYVYRQTSDRELALDLTQEIFISVLKSLDNYRRDKGSFRTWLYKIASNKIVDYYRSKYYKYSTVVEKLDDYELKSSSNIELDLELKEDMKEIIEIINSFEANIQQIVRLKIFGQLTFSEISKALELPESTVKTRYYSSINKIKKILKERENEQR